jgi:hypothetical protein
MSPPQILAAALLAALAPPQTSPPTDVTETRCVWLVNGPAGVSSVDTPELRLLEATARPGPLELAPPAGAQSVQCGRTSIAPAEHDDELLALGLPLFIVDVNSPASRLGALEISSGRFRYRLLEGNLTKAEGKAVSRRLDLFQARLRDVSR